MIQPSNWGKLHLRCAQAASTRPALFSCNRKVQIVTFRYETKNPIPLLHSHSEYELIVYLHVDDSPQRGGREPLEPQQNEQRIERGHIFLFNPRRKHMGHITASCQIFVVLFSLEPSIEIPIPEQWPVCPELADDAEKLSHLLLESNPGGLPHASSHLINFVLRALSLFTPEEQSCRPIVRRLDLAEEIQQMVINNPSRTFTLKDIASHFGMSVRQLSRSFHVATKDTIIKYILRCRLEIACSLLRESDGSIGDICTRAGLPDQAYFCRCFRKYFGISPSEYRRIGRQQSNVSECQTRAGKEDCYDSSD